MYAYLNEHSHLCSTFTRFSKGTSTHEDQLPQAPNRICPKGPNSSLLRGPNDGNLLKQYLPWQGPDPDNRRGPDPTLRRGPDPKNLSSKEGGSKARGPQLSIFRRGPLKDITFRSLIPGSSNSATSGEASQSSRSPQWIGLASRRNTLIHCYYSSSISRSVSLPYLTLQWRIVPRDGTAICQIFARMLFGEGERSHE